jgi:succinate-semialdehyde dehydrogenase/glutarate-semialdehyde dehydrogenase
MGTVAQHFLAGAYTAGRATEHTAVYSPGSGEHLADLPKATTADLDDAVAAARTAFADYARWSVYERADLCHRVGALIEQHADRLARLTSAEQGKPLRGGPAVRRRVRNPHRLGPYSSSILQLWCQYLP